MVRRILHVGKTRIASVSMPLHLLSAGHRHRQNNAMAACRRRESQRPEGKVRRDLSGIFASEACRSAADTSETHRNVVRAPSGRRRRVGSRRRPSVGETVRTKLRCRDCRNFRRRSRVRTSVTQDGVGEVSEHVRNFPRDGVGASEDLTTMSAARLEPVHNAATSARCPGICTS